MNLTKRFYNHRGVDLKSSDLIRSEQFASNMMNAQYTDGGAIEKRVGYQGHAASQGGYGVWNYDRYDPITGVQDPRIVCVGESVYELGTSGISVTYSGADLTAFLTLFVEDSQYRFQITVGEIIVLDQALGKGFDEASPYTLTQLGVAINALTDLTAVVSGDGSVPSAFLEIVREADLTIGDYSGTAAYWTSPDTTTADPLSTYYANRNNSDHENVSSVQIRNVIYFGSGFDELLKYDGQTVYRAGLPAPASIVVALSAGSVTGTNYVHRIQYAQNDAAGNIIEGNLLSSGQNDATAEQFDLTIANIEAGSGFNTNGAVVDGLQAGVNTITVDDGSGGAHTLKVGDAAYFFDGVSSGHVVREVTAITATTITVTGAAVDVQDNAIISNNLRILIWRSKTSAVTPSSFFLVDEIPNDSFNPTQSYVDDLVDGSLGEVLIEPITDRSPPPKGRYVSQWNGQIFIAGIPNDPTSIRWSDIDSPEYFPNTTNQLFIEPGNGDVITGIAPNNEVFTVHGRQSFTVISGEIATGQIRVETRARDVGCAAHATLTDIDGVLVWLSTQGPRMSAGGQVPRPLGAAMDPAESNQASRIDPAFVNDGKVPEEQLQLKRATSFNDSKTDRWFLFVPAETTTSGDVSSNSSSRIYVYDRIRDAWLIWDNMDMSGGAAFINNEIYFIERRFSAFESAVSHVMYRRHNLIDAYDYADNVDDVDFSYSPQWEALGEPSVLKDIIHIRVFSLESIANNQFVLGIDQEVNYQSDSAFATFTIDFSGGGYGFSPYGDDPYGDPQIDAQLHPMARTRLRSVRPKYTNSAIHQNVLVTGWELEFSTPYRPEFKR